MAARSLGQAVLAPLAVALVLSGAAWTAAAETLRVRSGDHPGFSRLVVEAQAASEWRFGRVEGGYALDLGRPDVAYDLREVYRLIGRNRVAAVRGDAESGRLVLEVGCDCHAVASTFRGSWVVIDVVAAPAPPESPFEAPLDREFATDADDPAVAPAGGVVGDFGASFRAEAETPSAAATRPATGTASTLSPDDDVSEAGGAALTAAFELPRPSVLPVWADVPRRGDLAHAGSAAGVRPERAAASGQAADRGGSDAAPAMPFGAAGAGRVADDEAQLLAELARAASQGLLEADLPLLERAREAALPSRDPAAAPERSGPEAPAPVPVPEPDDHVRVEAETSIDRDTRVFRAGGAVTQDGRACLRDDELDLAGWGDDADASDGITERRRALVGEFDRPDPTAVLALARYYVFLGFGAEAEATLDAFGAEDAPAQVVRELALILDGGAAAPRDGDSGTDGLLARQIDCRGRVALWSALASGGPNPGDRPNTEAILAAFSELPLHLRRHLGPGLAGRYLDLGDLGAATMLRNAIARAPGDHGPAFALLDARIAAAEGGSPPAGLVEAVVASDDALGPAAYAGYLSRELAEGRLPDQAAETAAALAFELGQSETGTALADLAVRAILAEGDFATARAELERLDDERGDRDTARWRAYALALADGAPDASFVREAFAARDALGAAVPGSGAAAPLANRLTALGFPDEALRYLPALAEGEAERLARAEALLAAGAHAEAFGIVAPLQGAVAERIRARALLGLGDPRGAAERFRAINDDVAADRAAWAAGAWDLLADSEDDRTRTFATQRLNAARSGSDEPAVGSQAGDRGPGSELDAQVAATVEPLDPPARGAGIEGGAEAREGSAPSTGGTDNGEGGRVARARAALAHAEERRAALEILLSRVRTPEPTD